LNLLAKLISLVAGCRLQVARYLLETCNSQLTTKFIFIISLLFATNSYATLSINSEPGNFDNISIINTDKLRELLTDDLKQKTAADRLSVNIKDYNEGIKLNSKHESYDIEIIEGSVNNKSRRFKYVLEFTSGLDSEKINVSGNYEEMVEVPVLSSKLPHGSSIAPENIKMVEFAKNKLQDDTIYDTNILTGKILKHAMIDGKPIRSIDLDTKLVVTRNHSVKIIYKSPSMTLQALGVAMDSGGKGDVIRVRNTSSNKIVKAEIQSDDTVIIAAQNL
jgi:flagella basal body P-ring formation protein FlgA